MNSQVADTLQKLNPETVESLQDLIRALDDSTNYHNEAADAIDDKAVESTFREIAKERKDICEEISGLVSLTDNPPEEDGTFLGSLRTIWTSFRGGLNGGDATVVLIEAERAEDVIVGKFKEILPKIAGNPANDVLLKAFEQVKSGHDRVLKLRNAYQAK